jgi:hypothetical protein
MRMFLPEWNAQMNHAEKKNNKEKSLEWIWQGSEIAAQMTRKAHTFLVKSEWAAPRQTKLHSGRVAAQHLNTKTR